LIELTRMISTGEDLLQSSFITNYSRYTVEFKRYYTALSDMLAVAGFEYICKAGRYVIKIFVLMCFDYNLITEVSISITCVKF
jgi:hypothetical protein